MCEGLRRMKKIHLEKRLEIIKEMMGGVTLFTLGMKKTGEVDFISVERCFTPEEKKDIVELKEPDYIG